MQFIRTQEGPLLNLAQVTTINVAVLNYSDQPGKIELVAWLENGVRIVIGNYPTEAAATTDRDALAKLICVWEPRPLKEEEAE